MMPPSSTKVALRRREMIDALLGTGYADVVLRGGKVVDVLTREIYPADVALRNEYILLVGDCSELVGPRTEAVDISGKFVTPGLIDPHMHFESSMLTPTEFSRLSLPHGTTTIFADPHEIANVLGVDGVRAMIEDARALPNRVLFCVPPLVPDLPGFETPGATIDSTNVVDLLDEPLVCGLGEMQGFSNIDSVYEQDGSLVDDLLASVAACKKRGKSVEGNAPSLFGRQLAAHNVLCGGHASCHETVTKEECIAKLRGGYTVFMREGSTQRNMAECIRVVTEDGLDSGHLCFCTDDLVAADLLSSGHIDEIIRRAVALGLDPVEAVQMATINPASHFGYADTFGAIAPGRAADLCVVGDLGAIDVQMVYAGGRLVAVDGELVCDLPHRSFPATAKDTVICGKVTPDQLALQAHGRHARVRAVGIIENQNLTESFEDTLPVVDGCVSPNVESDTVPFCVIGRHANSAGHIGRAFVHGLGIKRGAIAQTIGHDTHNLLVCGTDFDDMAFATNRMVETGGGISLVRDGRVVGELTLPIAGLMTDELDGRELADKVAGLERIATRELGVTLPSPFMHLSFLTLATSPRWKLTDMGLLDVENGCILDAIEGDDDDGR